MYEIKWHSSIATIERRHWEQVFDPKKIFNTYEFVQAVEYSKVDNCVFHYLEVVSNNEVVAIIPCFQYKMNLDLLSPEFVKVFSGRTRKLYPNFMKLKIFFLGTPVSICGSLWGVAIDNNHPHFSEFISTVKTEVKKKAKEKKCVMIILKEFLARDRAQFVAALEPDFVIAESLPDSFVPIGDKLSPFPSALREKYRRRIKRTLKASSEHELRWVIEPNYSQYSQEMELLYLQVLERSPTKFEKMNAAFFHSVYQHCKDFTFALLCFNAENKLVCFQLVFDEDEALIPLYVGLDYSYTTDREIYFKSIYRIIHEAERRGKRILSLGQNGYVPKAYAGAVFERLYIGAYFHNPALQLLLKVFINQLFPKTELPFLRCYRDDSVEIIEGRLSSEGIKHYEPIKTSNE